MKRNTAAAMKRTLGATKVPTPRKPRKARPRKPTGYVIYRGPSLLDGAPIVVIAITSKSSNSKTGKMLQTYIIRDDMSPLEAVRTGADFCICGDCKHRGINGQKRTCYVNLGRGPGGVFKCFLRGGYPDISDNPEAVRALGIARTVRLGAYGDPAAAPVSVWLNLTVNAIGWTGYTHQWRAFPTLKLLCMASVDSPAEALEAVSAGWRYFEVAPKGRKPGALEISCPASAEAGKLTLCERCLLCSGASKSAKNIVIHAHGIGAKYFDVAA